jgi:anti-sigma factor RsiW
VTSCSEIIPRLSAYRDGELSAAETAVVAAHLSGCPRCEAYSCDLAEIGELARDDRAIQVPDGLQDRIIDACEQSRSRGGISWRRWPTWGAAAAGFVLYLLGYLGVASYLAGGPDHTVPEALAVERILEESQLAFAGTGLSRGPAAMFEQRPESRLLDEIEEGSRP